MTDIPIDQTVLRTRPETVVAPVPSCAKCGRPSFLIEHGQALCGGCYVGTRALEHCFAASDFVREPVR